MKIKKFTGGYLLRLLRGEEVTASLTGFLKDNNISAGTVEGLGGVSDADLGFYDLPNQTYLHQIIPGNLELVHYWGNITLVDGEPFVHAHAVVSGADYIARSGHFFNAVVAITGEFVVRHADWLVSRSPDAQSGLNLMNIED